MVNLKRVFIKGGIISPSELKQVIKYAKFLGLDALHFGSRQDIILPAHDQNEEVDNQYAKLSTSMVSDLRYQNIVSSYVSSDIFSSTTPTTALPCGHMMHVDCLKKHATKNFKCPMCSKPIGDMTRVYQMVDFEYNLVKMPEEYRDKKVDILCHDCEKKSETPFHIVGLKCLECNSFNTRQI